jgi:hypothetical protein
LVLLAPATLFAATFQSLAQRLPATTDTIVAINVESVLNSPYAKQQQWREMMAENWAKRPGVVPPGVNKLLMGAEFIPSKAETRWEVTLMDMPKMPSLEDLCKAEGGNVDRVWDKDAVASPINAYFIPLSNDVLAVCTPGERSLIARWVRQPVLNGGAVTSEYTRGVVNTLNDNDTHVVMSLDLEGAFGLPNIRRFLADSELPELKGKNLDSMALTLSSLKGLTLRITVTDSINANVSIGFGKDAAELGPVAKPLLISVLDTAGMHLDDVAQWTFTVSGKEVRGNGKLSDPSFRNLIGVVQTPIPAAVAAAAKPDSTAPADPATASQRYYKSVSLAIDNLKPGVSAQATAKWWMQAAKRIDALPILNVDPALVDFGMFVSSKLKQLATVGAAGQTQINARVAGIQNPEYGTYDTENYTWASHDSNLAKEYKRQRQQAALEQKTQIQEQAVQILNEANGARQKIRAEMTQKYNVEF